MTSDTNRPGVFDSYSPPSTSHRPSHGAHSSAAAGSISTVRPRNRKLTSFVEDGDDTSGAGLVAPEGREITGSPSLRSRTGSPYVSRTGSPSPYIQACRSELGSSGCGSGTNSFGKRGGAFASNFLDVSWSSIQSMASAVMGTEDIRKSQSINGSRGANHLGTDRLSRPQDGSHNRIGLPSVWGPSGKHDRAAPGSKEDRQATLQSKRRELLLQANGDTMPDTQGNYKRRTSLEHVDHASQAQQAEREESEALVYIHRVSPNDSLTGVSIRYGCPLPVLRKSNGFWPSDSIQSRRIVVLPVAACNLRGERIPSDGASKTNHNNLNRITPATPVPSILASEDETPLKTGNEPCDTPVWKHECWMNVDGFLSPIELGRIPSKTLGFFPRARRKSLRTQVQPERYPDLGTPPSGEQVRRDSSRTPRSHIRDRSDCSSGVGSPQRHHQRRGGILLLGPGGVGTLDGSSTGPGPAPDKLNTFVNAHLPNLAISSQAPQTITSLQFTGDRVSFDSSSTLYSSSPAAGLENIGGAIEGWFRKVATKAKAGLNELQQPVQTHSDLGISGHGDLIELNEASEINTANAFEQPQDPNGLQTSFSSPDPRDTLRGRGMGRKGHGRPKND